MDIIKFPENLKTASVLSILLHGIISLPDVKHMINLNKTVYFVTVLKDTDFTPVWSWQEDFILIHII